MAEKNEDSQNAPVNSGYLKESDIQRLFTLSKIAVGVIGLVASIAIYFSYQSVQDLENNLIAKADKLQEEHNSKLATLEVDLKEMKNGLSVRSNQMYEEVKSIREYANKELDRSTNYNIKMIDQIRVDAAIRAESAAKLEINRILKDDRRMEELIELAIENRVFERLDSYADTIEENIKSLVGIVPEFILAVDRIRQGDRTALMRLDSMKRYSDDPFVKELAELTMDEKAKDYENYIEEELKRFISKKQPTFGKAFSIFAPMNYGFPLSNTYLKDSMNIEDASELLDRMTFIVIENDLILENVAHAFAILKEQHPGISIKMFDFEGVDNFKKELFLKNGWRKEYDFDINMFGWLPYLRPYLRDKQYGLVEQLEELKSKNKKE